MLLRSALRLTLVGLVAAGLAVPAAASAASEPSRTGEGAVRIGGAPSANPTVDPPASTVSVVVPMAFPVIGAVTYTDTFLACRGTGCSRRHLGQDIMGRKMMALIATFTGTVTYLQRETAGEGNILSIRSLDQQWSVNYIHINNDTPGTDDGRGTARYAFLPGLKTGAKVVRGQLVGWMGDSGNAEATAPHVHFELRKGDSWSGTVYNPFPSLKAAPRQTSYVVAAPHQPGELIAYTGGPVYQLTADGGRRTVPASLMAVYGWVPTDVVKVTGAETSLYPDRGKALLRNGSVVSSGGVLWVTTGGRRYQVTPADVAALGLSASGAVPVTADALVATPIGAGAVPGGRFRNGAFVRDASSSQVWLIEAGKRRAISTGGWANWNVGANQVAVLPTGSLTAVGAPPVGTVMGYRDGTLFRSSQGTFLMVEGVRRQIRELAALTYYNWISKRYLYMYDSITAALPLGAPIA